MGNDSLNDIAVDFEQKRLIKESFAYISSQNINIGKRFYTNLFQLNPDLKSLFHSNLEEQEQKLAQMLNTIVLSLDNAAALNKTLKDLGTKHFSYGVKEGDFSFVGTSLIKTLKLALEEKWTSDIEIAWKSVFSEITKKMLEGNSNY
jgi:hemoglobin-like flavoprotein